MAERKKTSGKKTKTKSAVKGTEPGDLPFGVILCGWILVGIGLVLLLGCVSSVYSGSEGNWLGPYFGKLIPETFCFIFGKLPVVAFTFALVLWGLCLALRPVRMRGIGLAVGMSLLTIDLACLLALKNYGESQLGRDVLMMNGGIVGQFFCKNIAEPVFGNVSALAPFLLLLAGLVLILVISFGLRPRHFAFVVSGFRWLVGLFMKRGKDDETAEEDDTESGVVSENIGLSKRKGITFLDDDTIFKEPDGFKLKHKGKLKPFSARKNWMETPVLARGNGEELDESTVAPTIAPTMPAAPVAADQAIEPDFTGEDPEILRLEQQLRDNYRNMSALEIKEIRDKIAEIRRAREMLNWERAHQNKIVVKGAVRGTQPDALPAETRDDATVVAENESERTVVAGQKQPDVAPTIAAFPGTENDDEPTLAAGGDASSDEETFMPEIVTSDEAERDPTMEQDPTYEAPNQIGTSSSGTTFTGGAANGIPQPDPTVHYDPYRIPTVDEILDKHDPQPADYTEEELNAIGRMLEEKLENFKVKGKVVGCETGPVITRFEVEPGPGVKVSQFSALQDDLAMALKAVSIRILAPIPGKGAVGIEIPNRKMQTIFGRDIFESDAFKPTPDKIIMALGKDISGEPFSMDLAKAPHLMIAGQTGSGKSVCINALMASMLLSKTPDELRMILVDPKAVELKMYENIPHLLAPVITKPEVAIQALQWLCYEMGPRTDVRAQAKVPHLHGVR